MIFPCSSPHLQPVLPVFSKSDSVGDLFLLKGSFSSPLKCLLFVAFPVFGVLSSPHNIKHPEMFIYPVLLTTLFES